MKLSPKVRSGVQNPLLVWRSVPGFEGFEISEYGDLRKGNRYMIPQIKSGSGRKHYRIYSSGKVYAFYAHQLVALAFIGPKPFVDAEVCRTHRYGRSQTRLRPSRPSKRQREAAHPVSS